MAKIISFSIFKGGTGKTTSAVNTAAALAEMGKRVLLVDLDQQASATKYLGIDPDTTPMNISQVFIQNVPLSLAVKKTKFGFDIVPSHELMSAVEAMLESGKDEMLLREKLGSLEPEYDYILLDTPPGKPMLTFNAIVAAKLVLVPVSAERMAIDGVADLIMHLHRVLWRRFNLDQDIRILFTMYKAGTAHSPGIVNSARKIYRHNILDVLVPESIAFPRSFEAQRPIINFEPSHPGAQAYRELARWLFDAKH